MTTAERYRQAPVEQQCRSMRPHTGGCCEAPSAAITSPHHGARARVRRHPSAIFLSRGVVVE